MADNNIQTSNQSSSPIPDGCLKRVAKLKYALYFVVALVALRLFALAADCIPNAPVESVVALILIMVLSRFTRRPAVYGVVSLLAALLLIYYPLQLVYIQSRILFYLFIIINIRVCDVMIRRQKSLAAISIATAILWAVALFTTRMLWETVSLNPANKGGVPVGAVKLKGNAEDVDLGERQANAIVVSASGKYVIASFGGDGKPGGIALLPVGGGTKPLFAKLGAGGVKLQGVDSKNGNIYATDLGAGNYYVLDPENLSLLESHKISARPFPFLYADSAAAEIVAPDMTKPYMGLKFYKPGQFDKPWYFYPSGGIMARMFPSMDGNTLPGIWSLDRIVPDISSNAYYITNSVSRYLLVIGMDDHKIRKIDTSPLPGASGVVVDPLHETLFMAKPIGKIEYYDTRELKLIKAIRGMGGVKALSYDPARDMIVAADYYGGTLKFIDRDTGEIVLNRYLCQRISDISVSSDGKVYASCAKGVLEVDPDRFGLQ